MATFKTQTKANVFTKPAPAKATPKIRVKASEKGCVSVYIPGNRFPTSLYPQAMLTLLSKATEIAAWIEANRDSLSWDGAQSAGPDDADTL